MNEALSLVRRWLATLADVLPRPLYDALETIYVNASSLAERYARASELSATDVLAALNLQTILPPLISIFAIYFAMLSLYRTTSFFIRGTLFLVKWGALIGVAGATLGYLANVVAPGSLFDQSDGVAQHRRRNPSRATRPRIWDSFEQHQQWRHQQSEGNPHTVDAGRAAREMVEKFVDATYQATAQGGWWSTLTSVVTKSVIGEDLEVQGKKGRAKGVRAKARSR